jgi:hypothetical protein
VEPAGRDDPAPVHAADRPALHCRRCRPCPTIARSNGLRRRQAQAWRVLPTR